MRSEIEKRCELLVENRKLAGKASFLDHDLIKVVAASFFTEKDKTADVDQLKDCKKLIRKKQGIFSEIRGNNELIIAAKMAASGNPEGYLDKLIDVYGEFQKGKILGSSYRVLAAASICDTGRASEAESLVEKTYEIMKGMRKDHPFLTTDEDTSFAVLLAMKDKSTEEILAELEEIYQLIKKNFAFHEDAAYSLSQVLATFDGQAELKSEKVMELFEAFKNAGAKYGKGYELASLGILVGIDKNIEDLVSEVVEVAEYLSGKKGFGILNMNRHTRLMLGTMIVSEIYSDGNVATGASVASSALSAVIAAQLCMYVAVMSAASASASSSN